MTITLYNYLFYEKIFGLIINLGKIINIRHFKQNMVIIKKTI